ncbi:MAG: hypothetical protein AB8F34_11320 [Akkermansiaceae bacterium]
MRRALTLLALAYLSSCWALAQSDSSGATGKGTEKPKTEISIVALGPKPTRKYKNVEGGEAPIMLLAKPGETPPPRLYYKGKEKGDKKTRWLTFNVPFNNPSAMREVAPGKALDLFRKTGGGEEARYERYVTIPAGEEGSRRIFFLSPAAKGPTPWDTPPRIRTISISAESMKGKQFILKNLSRFTVLHAFGDNVVSVEPMKTISYKRAKTGQLYRLAARYGTQKKIIYNTAVRLNGDGHIQLYALYDANPRTNSSRSVGVFRTMIPAPQKPLPAQPKATETP